MNPTLEVLYNRKSVRAYENRPISPEARDAILTAAMRAPTAGGLMLYSIIEVDDPQTKARLAVTCDNQPFIATAPMVLLFLADYQRWYDYFLACGVEEYCQRRGAAMRGPEEGDLFLACCDALIAAQTAVIAAESLGIGSCYIGDIMENYEIHRELFDLPRYTFPIALVCFGHPTPQQKGRKLTERFDRRYIVFQDRYRRIHGQESEEMYRAMHDRAFGGKGKEEGPGNVGQLVYENKFGAEFALEMNRSVRAILAAWRGQ
jgi:nitroreductase